MRMIERTRQTPINHGKKDSELKRWFTEVSVSVMFPEKNGYNMILPKKLRDVLLAQIANHRTHNKQTKYWLILLSYKKNHDYDMTAYLPISHISSCVPFLQPVRQRPLTLSHLRSKHWWLHGCLQFSPYDPIHSVTQNIVNYIRHWLVLCFHYTKKKKVTTILQICRVFQTEKK